MAISIHFMTCAVEILDEGTTWARSSPPNGRTQVALIFGGWGEDYDASCASAAAMLDTFDPADCDVRLLHVCQSGHWVVGDEAVTAAVAGRGVKALVSALAPKPGKTFAAGFREAADLLRSVDLALPAMHDADGTLRSVLACPELHSVLILSARQRRVTRRRGLRRLSA
jgi:hypothetical protein